MIADAPEILQVDRDARAQIIILAARAFMTETSERAAEYERGIDMILARHRIAGAQPCR
jgi:hypothetical protein